MKKRHLHIVTIVQRVLPHYRIAFFRCLRKRLEMEGVELRVVYGQEYPGTVPVSRDLGESWGTRIVNQYLLGDRLVWQPCTKFFAESDLVVVEQANRLLVNHLFFLWRAINPKARIAYWGHGRNMQRSSHLVRQKVKKILALHVDWWFAYTSLSAKIVESYGFPKSRITVMENSIDTKTLTDSLNVISDDEVESLGRSIGLLTRRPCLYVGGMHREKKLDFLIEACRVIKERIPEFEIIFVGDGSEQYIVEDAASIYPWIHYVGPMDGGRLAPFFKLSRLLLMPGLVGLAIVDSFTAGVPIVTTEISTHSPEIDYLVNNWNGVKCEATISSYAETVSSLLLDDMAWNTLREGCAVSAKRYTLENMTSRVANGVLRCLQLTETSFQ